MKRFLNTGIFFGLILLTGCDIFSTRDAEQPNTPKSNYIQPVEPSDVITNLQNSLKDLNVENYASCMTDFGFSGREFRFSASSVAMSQFPIMVTGWGKKEEREYFLNLKNRIPEEKSIILLLSNPLFGSPQGDSIIFTASYSLNVPHNDPAIPTAFEGELSFSMVRDSRNYWSIYYWRDSKTSDLPSWSELKGRFY